MHSRTHKIGLYSIFVIAALEELCTCCSRYPIITGYSRPHGSLVSTYNIAWKFTASCVENADVIQYQIQFVEDCLTRRIVTVSTGSNKTTALIVIPSCTDESCYVRVRAELSDTSFTDYSPCVRINNSLMEYEKRIEQYYQGVCVLILGVCGHGGPSEFFINDDLTLRPRSGNRRYNASYSSVSNAHTFCFINIIEDTILTEYCYQSHIAQCVLCSASTGEVYFLSRSDIYKSIQWSELATTLNPSKSTAFINHVHTIEQLHFDVMTRLSNSTIELENRSVLPSSISHGVQTDVIEYTFFVTIGAIILGVTCATVGVTVLIVLWYHNNRTTSCSLFKSRIGNLYDEPTFPTSIYQEINLEISEIKMGTAENTCNDITQLKECPAYVKHQDIN